MSSATELARLARLLETTSELSADDRAAIVALPMRIRSVAEKRDIIREGTRATESCLVIEGMACRYKMLSNGRRQIMSFHFAGDMPDLHGLHLNIMDHSLLSVTATRVGYVTHDALKAVMRVRPKVAEALERYALIDAAMYREWICNVGRRTALERVAHLICECFVRMRAVGLATLGSFELPLTQAEIGDATGLSNVHVNRTMKELRRLGLIQINGKVHSILNWDMLQQTGDFDPAYLQMKGTPLP